MALFHWTIQLDSIQAPSALEVKLGQDGNGSALPASQFGQITDTGQSSPLDGSVSSPLLEAMNYLVSWVWDDGLGDLRGPVSAPFTTLTATFNGARTELVTLTASQMALADGTGNRTESVTLNATQTAIVDGVGNRTESVTLTASQTGSASSDSLRTESVTLTDSQNWTVIGSGARTESVTLTDSQTAIGDHNRTRTESVTLTDSQTGVGIAPGSAARTEQVTLTASQTAVADHARTRTESITLTAIQTGVDAVQSRTRTETVIFTAEQAGYVPGVAILTKIGGDDAPRKKHRKPSFYEQEDILILELITALVAAEELEL